MNQVLRPLEVTTLVDQTYMVLRDRILSRDLLPGEFIREQEVSDALRISRTPVREALGRLASDGFIERLPHRGYRVRKDSIQDLLYLYPIVSTLEVLAGRDALPRLSPSDLQQLVVLNDSMREAQHSGNIYKLIELNNDFHRTIFRRCSNPILCELLETLRARVLRLEIWSATHPDHIAESLVEHAEIISNIQAKQFDSALAVLKRNSLQTYRTFYEEVLAVDDSPSSSSTDSIASH